MKSAGIRAVAIVCVLTGARCSSRVADEPIEPAQYESPVAQLQQLVGASNHLHTDEIRYRETDGKLFHCSYTFGVIDARDPGRMTYLADNLRHTIPGDSRRPGCIHLAWDGDIVYTVHRGNIDNPSFLSGWILRADPADPAKLRPVQIPVVQEPGVSYEGVDVADGLVFVALRQNGLGIYQRGAGNTLARIGTASGLSNAWGVRVRGKTAFVSDGLDGLAIVDLSDPRKPAMRGRLAIGGQARGLVVDRNTVYIAAGSAGLVIVDVSSLDAPKVLGSSRVGGSAIRVAYSDGRAYVAAWNDARVYDVSDPSAPRFIGAARMTRDINEDNGDQGRPDVTSRTLGVAARGDVLFAGNWHVIHSFRVYPDRRAPSLVLPEETNLVDFGPVAAGTRREVPLAVRNQGTAPLTLFDVRTSDGAFQVAPHALRIAPGATATLTVSYTAAAQEKATAFLDFSSDDPDNRSRRGYLVANQPGLGVGRPLTETTVGLVDGGRWSSSEAKGQVTLLAYFATF
jgi:ASPM-SPD-2-Hydin domain-containing protein/LVIVD repeat-containing protein